MGAIIFVSVLAAAGIIYVGTAKPFTPISRVTTELDEDIQKVRSGYGSYAEDYYKTLDTYRHRLGPDRVREYDEAMYDELDTQFEELLGLVEAGEVTYYDDARKWAGYFPEKDDRKARRSRADGAMAKWIGRTVDESVDKVLEGAKELLEKATEGTSNE